MIQRVSVYIDGFNLYYGLRSKGWRRYYWLDLRRLAEKLLISNQHLVIVRYFTAKILHQTDDPQKKMRQNTYLEALATRPDLYIHYGYYLSKNRTCSQCGATWQTYEEKMTDVNIAVELLSDAQNDVFDTAIIISGDSDLSGPINSVCQRYPKKRVIVAFPPERSSFRLQQMATAYFTIGRKKLSDSQFPDRITKTDGYILSKPLKWR